MLTVCVGVVNKSSSRLLVTVGTLTGDGPRRCPRAAHLLFRTLNPPLGLELLCRSLRFVPPDAFDVVLVADVPALLRQDVHLVALARVTQAVAEKSRLTQVSKAMILNLV